MPKFPSGKNDLPLFRIGLLLVEEGHVADHARDMATGTALYLIGQFTFFVLELVEPNFDKLVVFQYLRDSSHDHVGDTLLTDDNQWVEVVAHLS